MSVLWCGGEDTSFPNGVPIWVNTAGASFRSVARCAVAASSYGLAKSVPFVGGPVASAWLTFRSYNSNFPPYGPINNPAIGLGVSGTSYMLGLSFSYGSAGNGVVAIVTYNGTTVTALAQSAANTLPAANCRVDMQLISYGTSGTVNVYSNGLLVLSYTGNLTTNLTGVTGFDSVFLCSTSSDSGEPNYYSELIVANESTLGWQGLLTAALNANGPTQSWPSSAYTNINPTSINDANSAYTNTTAQDTQYGLIAIPSGSYLVKAVKTEVRAMATSGAASTNLKVGFNNTNTSTVAVDSAHALTSSFNTYEDLFVADPTSAGGTGAWGANLSGYYLDLRSA